MSGLSAADPRVKLALMLALSTGAVISRSIVTLSALLGLTLLLLLAGSVRISQSLGRARLFLKSILALSVLQLIFNRTGDPLLVVRGWTVLTDGGLILATVVALRLLIILSAALIVMTGEARDYLQALLQLRIPAEIALMTMAALRLLPILREAAQDVFCAVQMRGFRPEKQGWRKTASVYISVLVPIVAETIHRSEQIAVAMEARGFRAMPQRTGLHRLVMTKRDWARLAVSLVMLATVLIAGGG